MNPWARSCSFCWDPCLPKSSDSCPPPRHPGSALVPPAVPQRKKLSEYYQSVSQPLFTLMMSRMGGVGGHKEICHLENEIIPEHLGVIWVPKQKVKEPLHHPGPIGFPGVHSGRHYYGFLVPDLESVCPSRRYDHDIHSVPCKTLAQNSHFTEWHHCWTGRNPPEVVLQVWVGVGVAVGQIAGVRAIRELKSPGEWVQGDRFSVLFCTLNKQKDKHLKEISVGKKLCRPKMLWKSDKFTK